MEKTTRLLDVFIDDGNPATVLFTRASDEPGDFPTSIRIDRHSWIDMGMPHEVTVTIEPGDQLN